MIPKVKICGITNLEDALISFDSGADMLGMIFAESPRKISKSAAVDIADRLKGNITLIGVFSDPEDPAIRTICREIDLDMLQIYFGKRSDEINRYPVPVLRSYWINDHTDLSGIEMAGALLDFKKAPDLLRSNGAWTSGLEKAIVAGGLNCDNVAGIVTKVRPLGIDVASGVESAAGIKDRNKLKLFIERAKS